MKFRFVMFSGDNSKKFREAVKKARKNPYNHREESRKSEKILKDMLESFSKKKD